MSFPVQVLLATKRHLIRHEVRPGTQTRGRGLLLASLTLNALTLLVLSLTLEPSLRSWGVF